MLEEIKIYKVKRKKYLARWLLNIKMLNSHKLLLELLVAFLEPDQTPEMVLFVKIVNDIKLLNVFTKSSFLDV